MIRIGIDVAILATTGLLCMLLVIVLCCIGNVAEDEGEHLIVTAGFTSLVMVVSYVIMAGVLDGIF